MASKDRAVEAWEGALKDTSGVLEGMITAVREAGDAALDLQWTGPRKEKGGHHDIVTEGDIVSQRVAMTNLARVLPGLPFAAEESDEQAMVPGVPQAVVDADDFLIEKAYLALDPVDRTTNLACGGPDWGNTADILSGIHGAWVHLKGGSVWDFAVGVLAVEEAGGFACDLQGNPLKWDKLHMEVVLAANEEIAKQLVTVLDMAA